MPIEIYTPEIDKFIIKNANILAWRAISEAINKKWKTDFNRHQIRGRFVTLKSENFGKKAASKEVEESLIHEKGTGSEYFNSQSPGIRTIDDLIKHCKIDLTLNKITKHRVKTYQGFFRNRSEKDAGGSWNRTAEKVQMYSVELWMEPIEDAVENNKLRDELLADMMNISPKLPKIIRPRLTSPSNDRMLLELALYDHHYGKLAWAAETGENYDLKIADRRLDVATDDLLSRATGMPIERILFVVGHDLLHVDNMENTTTAGTKQDVDGRWQKAFLYAKRGLIRNIDKCRQIAPVDVVVIPGNHDRERCFYMGDTLDSYYARAEDVSVNNQPPLRKYYQYGPMGFMLTHGNEESPKEMESLFRREAKQIMYEAKFLEIHTGHEHRKRETRFNAADTFGGIIQRVCPSLSSADAWHFMKGYVGNFPESQANIYHKTLGFWGTWSHQSEQWEENITQAA